MKRFLDYNKNLKERTKELKQNMTKPEKKLRFEFFKKIDSNNINIIDYQNKVPLIKGVPDRAGDFVLKDFGAKIYRLDLRVYKQKQIQNFIVDFYIPSIKLVIEIDGESHFDEQGKIYDIERTQILEGLGLKVIRFTNNEIMKNFDGVCRILENYLTTKHPTMNKTILEKLNNRYATKVFDSTKKISHEDFETVLQAFRLTPSSFGLQPWKLIVVENQEIRENLVEHSWNQRQVADSSHLLVLCTYKDFGDLHISKYIDNIVKTRETGDKKELEGYENMMKGFLKNLPLEMRKSWVENQVHIALGNLINTCALLGIDDCPIGGFNREKYDEILGLKEKGLASVVLLPIGYRDEKLDKYSKLKKVRFDLDEIVEYIR